MSLRFGPWEKVALTLEGLNILISSSAISDFVTLSCSSSSSGPTYMVLSDGKKVLVHPFDDSHQHLRTARSSREMTKIITMDVDYQNNTICWVRFLKSTLHTQGQVMYHEVFEPKTVGSLHLPHVFSVIYIYIHIYIYTHCIIFLVK